MADLRGSSPRSEDDSINIRFQFGSIVVAKLGSFPWWPAMIDPSPETGDIYWLEDFEDLSKKNASHYHVVFFDVPGKVTRSWVHTTKIVPYRQHFPDPMTKEERNILTDSNLTSKRRLIEARCIAEAALLMPIEERRKKYTFIHTFKGKITLFDDDGNEQVLASGKIQNAENITIETRRTRGRNPKSKNESGTSQVTYPSNLKKVSSVATSTSNLAPAENITIETRRTRGRKPKSKNESGTSQETYQSNRKNMSSEATSTSSLAPAENITIETRRTRGRKTKSENESGTSQETYPSNLKKVSSGATSTSTLAPAENITIKRGRKRGRKPKSKNESGTSQETYQSNRKKMSSGATSSLAPDIEVPTATKIPRKTRGCSPALLTFHSPSSTTSRDIEVPTAIRRSRETPVGSLALLTSHSSSSTPSCDIEVPTAIRRSRETPVGSLALLTSHSSSSTPSCDDPPKRRGRKMKKSSGYQSQAGKNCETINTPVIKKYTANPSTSLTPNTKTSPVAHVHPNRISPLNGLLLPPLTNTDSIGHSLLSHESPQDPPTNEPALMDSEHKAREPLANEVHNEPSENSLETQMTSFLNRIQSETPKLRTYEKTLSNINLLVLKEEKNDVIDLTGEDDEDSSFLKYGELVYANLKGLQPWPAVIVLDPEINVCSLPENGAPNYVHVLFFHLNRRAWVPAENVTAFQEVMYHPEGTEMLNYEKYCKAVVLAQQTLHFSREQRIQAFSNIQNVPMTGGPIVPIKGPGDDIIVI